MKCVARSQSPVRSERPSRHAPGTLRRGATLVEVLMSLLIMSVGVLSVFSLYPIAITRSIQSTQAVHAKVLLGNAQAEMLASPEMLNGAPPWRPNTYYRLGDIVTGVPKSSTGLAPLVDPAGAAVSRTDVGFYICTAVETVASEPGFRRPSGNVEPDWPTGRGLTVDDGGFTWGLAIDPDLATVAEWPASVPTGARISDGVDLASPVYVVDPLGWAKHQQTGASARGLRDSYGSAPRMDAGMRMLRNDGVAGPLTLQHGLNGLDFGSRGLAPLGGAETSTVESAFRGLFRTNASAGPFSSFDAVANNQELTPNQLFRVAIARMTLDGTYESATDAIPLGAGTITGSATAGRQVVELPNSPESQALLDEWEQTVAGLEAADLHNFARVTLSSSSAQLKESRWLVSGYDDDLDGTTDVDGIDPSAYTVEVGSFNGAFAAATDTTVRFEVFEPRYTWLATVARNPAGGQTSISRTSSGGISTATCVVFFRRAFETALEIGFNAQIGNDPTTAADDPEDGSFDAALAEQNRSRAYIYAGRDTVAPIDGSSDDTLPQIAVGRHLFDSTSGHWYRIEAIVTDGVAGDIIEVELDRPAEVLVRDSDQMLTSNPSSFDPQVVIPQGIVRIFDLELEL